MCCIQCSLVCSVVRFFCVFEYFLLFVLNLVASTSALDFLEILGVRNDLYGMEPNVKLYSIAHSRFRTAALYRQYAWPGLASGRMSVS